MKIAFLTPEYPHKSLRNGGGLGTSIHNLAMALAEQGLKIHIVVIGQEKDDYFIEQGITYHILKQRKYPFSGFYFYRKHIEKVINKLIKIEKIDLIEAPDWTGITAFMNFNIPLIIRFHGSDTYFCHLEKRKQKLKNRLFETLAIKKAKAFIAPTAFAGEVSAKLFNIQKDRITTIHYGLDTSKFSNPNPEKYQEGKLLYIGTLIRKKGVLELPQILKSVVQQKPDVKLYLIGADSFDVQTQSSSTWKLMEQQLDGSIKNNIEYLGKVPYSEVVEHIKNSHVCIFPTFAETLGMVTIESMALHKPVVNSNIGWAKELIVDGESGFLIHPANHPEYADRITTLLNDKSLALQMGKNARKRVEDVFDMSKIVHQNINFYQQQI